VIIPAGLTAAMVNPGERAAVELYQDPTLTLGPGIVKGVVSQFVDSLAVARSPPKWPMRSWPGMG